MMRIAPLALSLACLAAACSTPVEVAADRSMPLTTTSAEARQLVEQARDLLENIEPDAAAKLLDQAIAKDADFAMAHALRAQVGGLAVARGHLDEAVRLAVKASPGENHWILAAKAQADGDAPTLKTHLDSLLAAHPEDKHVQQRMGFYHRAILGDDKAAATYFKKATELDPTYAPAFNSLGYSQLASGDHDGAEASFKRYIELLPNRPNPYDSYAEFLMKRGRFDESIAAYRQALEKDPAFPGSHTGIGNNLIFKGDVAGARLAFQKQLDVAQTPLDRIAAMRNTAASFLHEGRTADALNVFDDIGTVASENGLAPQVVGAHYDAAFVQLDAGQADTAAARLASALAAVEASSVPDTVKARQRLVASLMQARVLAAQGRATDAEAALASAALVVTRRNNPFEAEQLHEMQGLIALQQGRHDEAASHLAQAGSADPYVMYQRAVALEGAGKTVEASALYKQVADWNEGSLGYALVRARARAKSST